MCDGVNGQEAWDRGQLRQAQRLVVKVGTSTLTQPGGGSDLVQMERLVRGLSNCRNSGKEVLLVTSGAIGAGLSRLQLQRLDSLPEKQAAAAVGQGLLMHLYEKLFSEYGCVVAQVLLTRQDIQDPVRRSNARNTLSQLLTWGVIPIINENDTVAVDEIRFGDNDTLSARVAMLVDADLLVILTDTEGLHTSDPKERPGAPIFDIADPFDASVEAAGGGAGSPLARGGMVTKIRAAKLVAQAGIPTAIANGRHRNVLAELLDGKRIGTIFTPNGTGGRHGQESDVV